MTRFARLASAEAAALRGRRLWWSAVVAAGGSLVGGLAMAGLLVAFDGASAVEWSTVVVSRGSTAPIAVALLASLGVASGYRDGSWMHAALAAPAPAMRIAASAVPTLAIGLGLGAVAAVAAVAASVLVDPGRLVSVGVLAALPLAVAVHVTVAVVWSAWMLCVAHATGSPLATLGIGAGLPLVIEPAVAGALAQTALADARWLLPGASLRSLAELPVGRGAVLDGPPPELAPALAAAALGWTAIAAIAAWARARGPRRR